MIATTIEQSKALLKAGLSKESADCHWHFPVCKREDGSYTIYPEPDLYVGWVFSPDDIPAWSMSKLWEIVFSNCGDKIYEFSTELSPKELMSSLFDTVLGMAEKNEIKQ